MRLLILAPFFLITPLVTFPIIAGCVFPSLSLESAEQIALDRNKDIQTMKALLCSARQGKLEALSKWLPELKLTSFGYKTEDIVPGPNTRSAFMSQLNTTQALISTEKWYGVKIAALMVKELASLLDAARIDVLFDIRTLYYRLIFDQETIATAKQKIDLLKSLVNQEQADYRIGTTILLNVNQSKVAVANATAVYYNAIKRFKIDLDQFVRVLGYDPGQVEVELREEGIPIGAIFELSSKVEKVSAVFMKDDPEGEIYKPGYPETEKSVMAHLFSPEEFTYWEETALSYRPELATSKTRFLITQEEVGKKRGEYLPKVNLELNYGGYPNKMLDSPSSSFFNQNFSWAVGYSIRWLLFDGFGRRHQVSKAICERNAAQFEFQKSLQMTYEDVRKQIFDIEDAVANYVTAESNVRLADQTLDLAQSQLEIGYITVFDYQIVVDNLIEAINIRNRAKFDLISGYYGLVHASGRDLACN